MEKRLDGPDPSGATPIDDISHLKASFIRTRKDLYAAEFININKALLKYIARFSGRGKFRLDEAVILGLHRDMFSDVWDWAGRLRKTRTNVGVDPHKISTELKKLTDDFGYWVSEGADAIQISAKLHHRLVWIHPFENGNGRQARILVNLYLEAAAGTALKWPEDEMFIESRFRKKYIGALRAADGGDYGPLINIHSQLNK